MVETVGTGRKRNCATDPPPNAPRKKIRRSGERLTPISHFSGPGGGTKSAVFNAGNDRSERVGTGRKRNCATDPLPNAPRKKIRRSGTPLTPTSGSLIATSGSQSQEDSPREDSPGEDSPGEDSLGEDSPGEKSPGEDSPG